MLGRARKGWLMTILDVCDLFGVFAGFHLLFLNFRRVVRQVRTADRNWVYAANSLSYGSFCGAMAIHHLLQTPWLTSSSLIIVKVLMVGAGIMMVLFSFERLWTKSPDRELADSVDK